MARKRKKSRRPVRRVKPAIREPEGAERKSGPQIKPNHFEAPASKQAGSSAREGEPIDRPAWVPEGDDFEGVPETVRQNAVELIEPMYQQLVVEADDMTERFVGITMVHLMWAEILEQHEPNYEYHKTSNPGVPQDHWRTVDRHLRTLNTKIRLANCLTRIREMRRRSETATQPARVMPRPVPARPAAAVHRECGKAESCHPKMEAGRSKLEAGDALTRGVGGADRVSATQPEGEWGVERGNREGRHPKTEVGGSKLEAGDALTRAG